MENSGGNDNGLAAFSAGRWRNGYGCEGGCLEQEQGNVQFSYPQVLIVSTPEVIRAAHLRQQKNQESVVKIERAFMKHSSQACVLGSGGCGVRTMQCLLQLGSLQLEFCLQQLVNKSLRAL